MLIRAALILASCSAVLAQDAKTEPQGQSHAERCQSALEQHRERIEARAAELRTVLKHLDRDALPAEGWAAQWAGVYYTGDGLGMNASILLAPDGRISYTWHGCMGLYDGNYGEVTEALPDGLKLKLAIPPELSSYDFMSDRLYFVRWGKEKFLVPSTQMMQLVNNYNQGGYARSRMFSIPRLILNDQYHRRHDAPPGKPELPPEFAKLLLDKPLKLTVTNVNAAPPAHVTGDVWVHSYTVELEGGSEAGAFVGMELDLRQATEYGTLTLTEVGPESSRGTARFFTGTKDPMRLVNVGQKLTKSPPEQPETEQRAPAAPGR